MTVSCTYVKLAKRLDAIKAAASARLLKNFESGITATAGFALNLRATRYGAARRR